MTDDPLRTRLLDALAASVAEHGYAETTVADIVRLAHTSKREFYQRFTDKQQCFLALMRTGTDDLVATIRGAVDPQAPWRDQVGQAVRAFVEHMQANPGLSMAWARELPTVGPEGRRSQRRNFEQLAVMLADLTATAAFRGAGVRPMDAATATLLLGGLRELAAQTVEDGSPVGDIVAPATRACLALLADP